MRWFVEVSRVGESSLSENYCVEAKQWQAALQEARKLRGDSGALSKFSIELLDDGYRAVDPTLKLRYLVNQAPGDAPLTPINEDLAVSSAKSNGRNGKPHVAPVVSPTAFATSVAPESAVKSPAGGIPRPTSHAPRAASSAPPATQPTVVPDDPLPPPAIVPTGLGASGERELPEPALPGFEVVRARAEEPRPDSPITYREVAYAVKPGTSRAQVEALLWARYQAVASSLAEGPAGRFVQLAVFDHVFQTRPERPPIATLAWKDWRGSPVLALPGFGEAPAGPLSQVPPPAFPSAPPPAPANAPGLPAEPPAPAVAQPEPAVVASPIAELAAPAAALVGEQPPAQSPEVVAPAPLAAVAPAPDAEPAAAVVEAAAASVVVQAQTPPAPVLGVSTAVAARTGSSPDSERHSRPRLAVPGRRRAGEDLIGELFEIMHQLRFERDVAMGAQFVLSVLDEVLPCEGVLIHVFDINTTHFVVVRAKGPNAKSVLLQRMRDQDPLAQSVMRSVELVSVSDATNDPRFNGPRWEAVGVAPKIALCGAVRQGGRYLGLIELVNPAGGTPFHPSELNALDYICEQFAEFLSNRPIIVAADVILAKA